MSADRSRGPTPHVVAHRLAALSSAVVVACSSLSLSGCYLSHQLAVEANADGGVPARDAGTPPLPPGRPCDPGEPVLRLDRVAVGLGDAACRSLEVSGGSALECAGIAVSRFRVERSVGSDLLIHVTVLNDPPRLPGSPYRVALRSFVPETCTCIGGGWAEEDASLPHTWVTGSPALEIGVANPAARYRIEACAIEGPVDEDDGRLGG